MKYIKLIFIISMLFFIASPDAYCLSCSSSVSKSLGTTASYVKASYELIDNSSTITVSIDDDNETTFYSPNYRFDISIYNITEDIYVTITDSVYSGVQSVHYSDTTDGTYTFSSYDFGQIHTYTIKILSDNSECPNELIRSITLVQPMYNVYSEYTYCKSNTGIYCRQFTTTDLGLDSVSDFLTKIGQTNNTVVTESEESTEDNITSLIKDNLILYIIIFVIVIVITIVVIIIIRKKQKNKGWEL